MRAMFPASPAPTACIYDTDHVLRDTVSILASNLIPQSLPALQQLISIVDFLGHASARAQGLRSPVTSIAKLHHNPTHKLYIMKMDPDPPPTQPQDSQAMSENYIASEHETNSNEDDGLESSNNIDASLEHHDERAVYLPPSQVVGLLKIGVKNLFVSDEYGRQIQISLLCVLDFYIHDSVQRCGYGKRLFEYMLETEQTTAAKLAYDRPSPRMMSFLKKHYTLHDFISQANNFIIFKQFGLSGVSPDIRRASPTTHTQYLPQQPQKSIYLRPQTASRYPATLTPIQPSPSTPASLRYHGGDIRQTPILPQVPRATTVSLQSYPFEPTHAAGLATFVSEGGFSKSLIVETSVADGLAALQAEAAAASRAPLPSFQYQKAASYGRRRMRDF
ncbi:touch receptor neuron protein Mec-17-domain-containing protein [Chytriomyces cf. hyalinus JEL632]|nr:touch receptor neuron protein Mec-17-domain-containing protein [Chytriomyces cf. hyalinus JEL632]